VSKGPPYKVLIVDDSEAMCAFLCQAFSADPSLEVVGKALNADAASELLRRTQPDVMTLDVMMPGTDGLTLLRKVMRSRPLPVLMLSAITDTGTSAALDALEAGAVDFLVKRLVSDPGDISAYTSEIVRRVRKVAQASAGPLIPRDRTPRPLPDLAPVISRLSAKSSHTCQVSEVRAPGTGGAKGTAVGRVKASVCLVALGASTGGPEALRKVLKEFYSPDCSIVISQHMPARFMGPFAARLNASSRYVICLATEGQLIEPGHGYVAPGDRHLSVVKRAGNLFCALSTGDLVNGHRPSVDIMFESISRAAPERSLGVLMTGMGEDGARGLKALHDLGVPTIVQDKFSSVVWGMPGRAFELGAADQSLALDSIGPALNALLGGTSAVHSAA